MNQEGERQDQPGPIKPLANEEVVALTGKFIRIEIPVHKNNRRVINEARGIVERIDNKPNP